MIPFFLISFVLVISIYCDQYRYYRYHLFIFLYNCEDYYGT